MLSRRQRHPVHGDELPEDARPLTSKKQHIWHEDHRSPEEEPKKKKHLWPRVLLTMIILSALILVGIYLAARYLIPSVITLRGEDEGRVNIMVLGVDGTARLSDTMMMVSLDTSELDQEEGQLQASMISFPRDLLVEIPGYGEAKLNAAYPTGEQVDHPGGGVGLAKETLESISDQEIHYYAAFDFNGFQRIIDAVGGVTIDVPQDLYDPYYPTGDGSEEVFSVDAGIQEMDGATALRYARSRQTTSDFDRAARQQQVILAVIDELQSAENLASPNVVRSLYSSYQDSVTTDISTAESIRFASLAQDFNPDTQLTRHVIDTSNYLTSTSIGGYYQIPRTGDFLEIQAFIADIFNQTQNTLPKTHEADDSGL